jgi:hypothetical protein
MSYRFYVVFHKILFDSAYKTLSEDTIKEHMRFMAVNSSIKKAAPTELMPYIFQERDLQWYNAFLQANKWFENSALLHVAKNKELCQPFSHVGFFQYDMDVDASLFTWLDSEIASAEDPSKILFYHKTENSLRHLHQVIMMTGWQNIIGLYNITYGTNHNPVTVMENEIPLYNTFLIPSRIFQDMMNFTERASSYIFEMMGYSTDALPYHLERLHGVFLLLKRLDGVLPIWKEMPGIGHNASLKEACAATRV